MKVLNHLCSVQLNFVDPEGCRIKCILVPIHSILTVFSFTYTLEVLTANSWWVLFKTELSSSNSFCGFQCFCKIPVVGCWGRESCHHLEVQGNPSFLSFIGKNNKLQKVLLVCIWHSKCVIRTHRVNGCIVKFNESRIVLYKCRPH